MTEGRGDESLVCQQTITLYCHALVPHLAVGLQDDEQRHLTRTTTIDIIKESKRLLTHNILILPSSSQETRNWKKTRMTINQSPFLVPQDPPPLKLIHHPMKEWMIQEEGFLKM